MMYEINDVRLAATLDKIKSRWARLFALSVIKDVDRQLKEGRLHIHLSNGSDTFCSNKAKFKIWVEVSD